MLSVLLHRRDQNGLWREEQHVLEQWITEQEAMQTPSYSVDLNPHGWSINSASIGGNQLPDCGQFGSCRGQQSVHSSPSLWQPLWPVDMPSLLKSTYFEAHAWQRHVYKHTNAPHRLTNRVIHRSARCTGGFKRFNTWKCCFVGGECFHFLFVYSMQSCICLISLEKKS